MHSIRRSLLVAFPPAKLLTFDRTCNNIRNQRPLLGQIRREIHFLPKIIMKITETVKFSPAEFFLDVDPREPELGAYGLALDKVEHPIWKEN